MNSRFDRFGYYLVNGKKFHHKILALIENKNLGHKINWFFNDDVYGSIDWSKPILYSLDELYRKRAQQLRDSYDYLTLYYSGGADSSNMLRTFVKNNIFLDEIVMQFPEPVRPFINNIDKSGINVYSEIPFSAIPILEELKPFINSKTVIRYQDTAPAIAKLLSIDNWFEHQAFGVDLSINGLARQYAALTEPHIMNLCDKGKRVAQILGTDKPLLRWIDGYYYSYFLDTTAFHVTPVDFGLKDVKEKAYHTEFFYWTPDFPEVVIKQAQEVKKYCELDPVIKKIICEDDTHIGILRDILHPIIYPSSSQVPFVVDKDNIGAYRKKDQWFWTTATEEQKNNFHIVMNYLDITIGAEDKIGDTISNGITATRSRLYEL